MSHCSTYPQESAMSTTRAYCFYLIALLAPFLGGCDWIGSDGATRRLLESTRHMDENTPLVCQYRETNSSGREVSIIDWYLIRQPNRIEIQVANRQDTRLWLRDLNQSITFIRFFKSPNLAIEYNDGDLNAAGLKQPWETLWSLIDPNSLPKNFVLAHTSNDHNLQIQYFVSKPAPAVLEVAWLPNIKLPINMIDKTTRDVTSELLLLSCKDIKESPVEPMDETKSQAYRHIDYVDIGDMESDPAIKLIIPLLKSGESTSH